jgi:hypothetical protein
MRMARENIINISYNLLCGESELIKGELHIAEIWYY